MSGGWLAFSVVRVVVDIVIPIALAGLVATFAAMLFRFKWDREFPESATLIMGLGTVTIALNTRLAVIEFVGEGADPLALAEVWTHLIVFAGGIMISFAGRHVGDNAGKSRRLRRPTFSADFSPLVRATGRVITVTIPNDIADIGGYDAVSEETKQTLAGKELHFPRGLTVDELRKRFTARLRASYDVGYVDVDLDVNGSVEYLALGKRAIGLGPTLSHGTQAVALRADPPFNASPGDTVEIWTSGEDPTRLGTAEFRAAVGQVTTIVTEERTAKRVDPTTEYRLMTLPDDIPPDRAFASMLRRADDTMDVFNITEGSDLIGIPIGAVAATVIAIRSVDSDVNTLPNRGRRLRSGDEFYAIGDLATLRKLERVAAAGNAPHSVSS